MEPLENGKALGSRAYFNLALSVLSLLLLSGIGVVIGADGMAIESTDLASVFAGFSSYGFGGLMTLALGYALVGLYKTHKEEREKWLASMEKQFDRLIVQLKDNDDSRAKMAQELRDYIHTHEGLSRELRELVERLRKVLEQNGGR